MGMGMMMDSICITRFNNGKDFLDFFLLALNSILFLFFIFFLLLLLLSQSVFNVIEFNYVIQSTFFFLILLKMKYFSLFEI